MVRVIRSITRVMLAAAAGFIVLVVVLLLLFQRNLIYFPRRYEALYKRSLPGRWVVLEYSTREGAQAAFYVPPRGAVDDETETPLWVMFTGNASLALHWDEFVESWHGKPCAFLLVDYPGYGACAGNPTRDSLRACGDDA